MLREYFFDSPSKSQNRAIGASPFWIAEVLG
jgi:hypothetical protein